MHALINLLNTTYNFQFKKKFSSKKYYIQLHTDYEIWIKLIYILILPIDRSIDQKLKYASFRSFPFLSLIIIYSAHPASLTIASSHP